MIAESRAFESWGDYQAALVRAVTPLSGEQLGRPILAGRRTAGEIAEHIAFGRALHLSGVPGVDRAGLEPYLRWDDEHPPRRTAAEIAHGLEVTWRVIEDRVVGGSVETCPAMGDPSR